MEKERKKKTRDHHNTVKSTKAVSGKPKIVRIEL